MYNESQITSGLMLAQANEAIQKAAAEREQQWEARKRALEAALRFNPTVAPNGHFGSRS